MLLLTVRENKAMCLKIDGQQQQAIMRLAGSFGLLILLEPVEAAHSPVAGMLALLPVVTKYYVRCFSSAPGRCVLSTLYLWAS